MAVIYLDALTRFFQGVQALHELLQADVVQSIKKSRPGSGASHHPTHQNLRKLVGRSVVIYYEVSKDRIDILRFGKPQGSQPERQPAAPSRGQKLLLTRLILPGERRVDRLSARAN
jgi:hypothetical protein